MADEQEQEKSYEVKDKRRVNEDGTLKEEAEAAKSADQAKPEETKEPEAEAPKETAEEESALPQPSVYDVLLFSANMMAEQAWVNMGLHLLPGQKEPKKDMVQAKIAIDTIVFVADKVDPYISDEDRKALKGMISNLQMNYISHR